MLRAQDNAAHLRAFGFREAPRVLTLLALLSLASPAASDGCGLRQLNTSELEALLRGSRITQPDREFDYMRNPEEFREDGTYVRYDDNFEARGKYEVRDNSVCFTETKRSEICRTISLDPSGHYWITKRSQQPGQIKISVSPIAK